MERILRARMEKDHETSERLTKRFVEKLEKLGQTSPEKAARARKAFDTMITRASGMHVIGRKEQKNPKGKRRRV